MRIIKEDIMSPEMAANMGLLSVLADAISTKTEYINDINSIKITADSCGRGDLLDALNDIIDAENNTLGKLQELSATLDPAAQSIEDGKQEVKDMLGEKLQPNKRKTLHEAADNYFVSYYEEYPIYEPAEGGYYYAGRQLVDSEEFDNLEDAQAYLDSMAPELSDQGFEKVSNTFYIFRSKYIGEDAYYTIETEQGADERGYHPYE